MFVRRLTLAAVFAATLALAGCAANPVTGRNELSLVSTAHEIDKGRELYQPTQQGSGGEFNSDPELSRYVRTVGNRLAAVSDRDLPYEFTILHDSTPNAWALPGGKIAISRGMLVEIDNEAELAAVLAHEIVHAAARHSAKGMERDFFGNLALMAVAMHMDDRRHGQYIVGASALGLRLVGRKYSREQESEADYYGMKYMHAAGYDTRGATAMHEKFAAKTHNHDWLQGLFATHPPSRERANDTRAALAEFPPGGETGRTRFQQKVGRLKARARAYEQADEALRRSDSNPSAALRLIDQAITRVPDEGRFYGIKGHILLQQERARAAVAQYEKALSRRDHYFMNYLGLGLAHMELRNFSQARRHLERSHGLLPTALASYHLGEMSLADGDRRRAKTLFEAAAQGGGAVGAAAKRAFTALDIQDNPNAYFDTRIQYQGGQVLVYVRNSTAFATRNIGIGIVAAIDGHVVTRQQTIYYLPAGGSEVVYSGIFYAHNQYVEAVAEVLRAQVDE